MISRYNQARECAGLSRAQATKLAGFNVADIEQGRVAGTNEHETLAELYRVSVCWLAGHDTSLDLTDLAQHAQDKGVSFSDWQEIATFLQSRATCKDCTKERGDG